MLEAGILGELNYGRTEGLDCLEIGVQIAKLELLRFADPSISGSVSRNPFDPINNRLKEIGICYTFKPPTGEETLTDIVYRQVDGLISHLRRSRNHRQSLAFILVGRAGYYLSFRGNAQDLSELEDASKDFIHYVQTSCDANVKPDALFTHIKDYVRRRNNPGPIHSLHKALTDLAAIINILIVLPDQDGSTRSHLNRRNLQQFISLTKHRESFLVEEMPSCVDDFCSELRQFRPRILHFEGRGGVPGLCLKDDVAMEPSVLAEMFKLTETVRGVVFNACYTQEDASVVAKTVDNVIAMEGDESSAVLFAEAFYKSLGDGETFAGAFNWAVLALAIGGHPDVHVHLLSKWSWEAKPCTARCAASNCVMGAEGEVDVHEYTDRNPRREGTNPTSNTGECMSSVEGSHL